MEGLYEEVITPTPNIEYLKMYFCSFYHKLQMLGLLNLIQMIVELKREFT